MELETLESLEYGDNVTVITSDGEELEGEVSDTNDCLNHLTVELKEK